MIYLSVDFSKAWYEGNNKQGIVLRFYINLQNINENICKGVIYLNKWILMGKLWGQSSMESTLKEKDVLFITSNIAKIIIISIRYVII